MSKISLPSPNSPDFRQLARQYLRYQRRSLSVQQQRQASRQLAQQLQSLPAFQNAQHIALYWPQDGEINALNLRSQKKHLYLPVIRKFPDNRLFFAEVTSKVSKSRLAKNRFNIPEPRQQKALHAKALDIILLPLTGFDKQGNRLGMGGGYYDRSLAFKQRLSGPRPLLIGIAHDVQELPNILPEKWDIPLNWIITPLQKIACSQTR
jgi:5-formyltetrahydrofolate cyclo-ligase